MKKTFLLIIIGITVLFSASYAIVYFATYSEGVRTGELIKFSNKGFIFKTWEGEISQGISGAQIFSFSVEKKDEDIIKKLEQFQGEYVKISYIERFATISYLGDTKYFVVAIEKAESPHFRK